MAERDRAAVGLTMSGSSAGQESRQASAWAANRGDPFGQGDDLSHSGVLHR
jgi:hypothetical protein